MSNFLNIYLDPNSLIVGGGYSKHSKMYSTVSNVSTYTVLYSVHCTVYSTTNLYCRTIVPLKRFLQIQRLCSTLLESQSKFPRYNMKCSGKRATT